MTNNDVDIPDDVDFDKPEFTEQKISGRAAELTRKMDESAQKTEAWAWYQEEPTKSPEQHPESSAMNNDRTQQLPSSQNLQGPPVTTKEGTGRRPIARKRKQGIDGPFLSFHMQQDLKSM